MYVKFWAKNRKFVIPNNNKFNVATHIFLLAQANTIWTGIDFIFNHPGSDSCYWAAARGLISHSLKEDLIIKRFSSHISIIKVDIFGIIVLWLFCKRKCMQNAILNDFYGKMNVWAFIHSNPYETQNLCHFICKVSEVFSVNFVTKLRRKYTKLEMTYS